MQKIHFGAGFFLDITALTAFLVIKAMPKMSGMPVNAIIIRTTVFAREGDMKVILWIDVHFGEDALSASFLRFEPSMLIVQPSLLLLSVP